jgi:hypothetical protein
MPFGGISAADQEIQRIDQPTLALLQCAGVRHAQAEALNPFLLPAPHCGSMLAFFTTSLTLSISRFSALPSTSALPPAGSMPVARSCFSAAGEFGSRDRLRGDLVDGRLRHTGAREEPDDGRQSKRATAGSQRARRFNRVSAAPTNDQLAISAILSAFARGLSFQFRSLDEKLSTWCASGRGRLSGLFLRLLQLLQTESRRRDAQAFVRSWHRQ